MARGAADRDVRGRAFWQAALTGKPPTAEQVEAMNPFRRVERPKGESAGDGEAGWAILGAALKSLNDERVK